MSKVPASLASGEDLFLVSSGWLLPYWWKGQGSHLGIFIKSRGPTNGEFTPMTY